MDSAATGNTQLKTRIGLGLLALCGAIPLLGLLTGNPPDPLVMLTLFVVAYFARNRLKVLTVAPGARALTVRFVVAMYLSTLTLETLAWTESYFKRKAAPALFHPQLIPDLLIGIGFYASWALSWWIALRRYHFSVREVFIVTGLYGVFMEQNGAAFMTGLAVFPIGIIVWLYVFAAYGSTAALAVLPFRDAFPARPNSRWKYALVLVLLFVLSFVTSILFGLVLNALHLLPPKRPIWEAPFF